MSQSRDEGLAGERWARLRFAIIGPLLAAPPPSPGTATVLAPMTTTSTDGRIFACSRLPHSVIVKHATPRHQRSV